MRRLINLLSELSLDPPFSWGFHAAVAIPLTWAFGPGAVVVFYLLREAEQAAHEYANVGAVLDPRDHLFDVLAPAIAAAASALFLF